MAFSSCDFLSHGTYLLSNAKGGTALDVAPWLRTRVEAYQLLWGNNQKWDFINTGDGWAIQSCHRTNDGRPLYLSVQGHLCEGAEISHSTVPMSWYIWLVDDALRITWPKTDYVVALGDEGSTRNGTPVQLMRLQPGLRGQLWHFTRCSVPKPPAPDMPTPLTPPDVHVFVHMHEDVALQLDNASRKGVRHLRLHKEHSQRWKIVTSGKEEVIQTVRGSLDGQPLYLNVQGPAKAGARVIASPYPVGWHIERSQCEDGRHTMRVFWPKTNLVISAEDSGDTDSVVLAEYDDAPSSQWVRIDIADQAPETDTT